MFLAVRTHGTCERTFRKGWTWNGVSRKDARLYHLINLEVSPPASMPPSFSLMVSLLKPGLISPRDWFWLPSLFLFVAGSTEKCWNLHGNCREECHKDEKVFIFCPSGKLCCVKPKFQPKIIRQWISGWSRRAQQWRKPCPESEHGDSWVLLKHLWLTSVCVS